MLCKVFLLCSALYATCPHYVVLCLQSVLIGLLSALCAECPAALGARPRGARRLGAPSAFVFRGAGAVKPTPSRCITSCSSSSSWVTSCPTLSWGLPNKNRTSNSKKTNKIVVYISTFFKTRFCLRRLACICFCQNRSCPSSRASDPRGLRLPPLSSVAQFVGAVTCPAFVSRRHHARKRSATRVLLVDEFTFPILSY